MTNHIDCPSQEQLQGWASGDLTDDAADTIVGHIEVCHVCEQTLTRIESNGPLREVAVAAPPRHAEETQCKALVGTLQTRPTVPIPTPSQPLRDPLIGSRIQDYELLECLGQGGMGAVYQAQHTHLRKIVALKILARELIHSPEAISRFRREITAVGLLEHPNIVRALDAGEVDGVSFLAMELIDGIDLAKLTSGQRTLEIADACEIARQAAMGLHYAHSQGLIHRDIKPSNLMLSRDSHGHLCIKVLDLGLATIEGTDSDQALTRTGQLIGTLEFMAPEQADSAWPADHRADIYSLGATLYRLLAGSSPFSGPRFNTTVKRLHALTSSAPTSIQTHRDDLPTQLVSLIDRMLARQPEDRPQDLSEVATELADFTADQQLDNLLARGFEEQGRSSLGATDNSSLGMYPPAGQARRQSASSMPPTGRTLWLLLAGIPFLTLFLGTFWLQTDGGYIRIETDAPSISTSVEVLRNGDLVETVQVRHNMEQIWYRSGRYEIRFATQPQDGFTIDGGRLTITRNSVKVVSISQAASLDTTSSLPNDAPEGPPVTSVTTVEDGTSVPGSLRSAIHSAIKGQIIRFDPELSGQTIKLYGDPLIPRTDLSIDARDLSEGITIDAGSKSRVMQIDNTLQIKLENVILANGRTFLEGAGIVIRKGGARVSLVNCRITRCESVGNYGGAIACRGQLTLKKCILADNHAAAHGGAIAFTKGYSYLENCLITNNSTSSEKGAAISLVYSAQAELVHCTIADNSSGVNLTPPATVTLESTIIAGNAGGRGDFTATGNAEGLTTRGINIIERLKKGKVIGAVPLSVDPLLVSIDSVGGFPTMSLREDSPAIDAAVISEKTPNTDFYSNQRVLDGDHNGEALPDLGAVEFNPLTDESNDSAVP